jgi:hypothetical protein
MHRSASLALLCIAVATAAASKPGGGGGGTSHGSAPNPEIAYISSGGNTSKLVVSNEDGTNANTLYSSSDFLRFDLAPRAQHQIAVSIASTTDPSIVLLSYDVTGTGAFATTATRRIASVRRGTFVDFSPDGTKLAFACCSNGQTETLVVYDLTTNTTTPWATDSFFWDVAWFRDGNSIAYSAPNSDGSAGDTLYEVPGPGMTPQPLLKDASDIYFDASRTDPDALVVNYHDAAGNALTELWRNGSFVDANLTNSTVSFFGELNCRDTELAFLGPPNNSPAWYIRDLTTGLTRLFSRTYYHWVQFWPTCS